MTKNGRGRFVVMNIEDYEKEKAEKKLLLKLQEAEEAVKDGNGWLTLDELYQVNVRTINKHINNILQEGELDEATIWNFRIVQQEE